MGKTISLKFYTVRLDGKKYWTTGKSRHDVARRYGVSLAFVTGGADTVRMKHISEHPGDVKGIAPISNDERDRQR